MNRRPLLNTCIALALGVGGSHSAPDAAAAPSPYPVGETVRLDRDGFAHALVLFLPHGYTDERTWPVVFHYPGTGGRPSVDLPRAFAGSENFILVGMDYVTRNMTSLNTDYLPLEIAALRSLRDDLAAELSIDTARVYVGGFSKGGWFASEFAEVYMREFAGAYILGAGKSHRRVRQPVAFGPVKKPVYIGTGQLDPNYIYSVRAIEHFRRLGASVTFDEFFGLGHTIKTGSDAPSSFQNWWAVEAARGTGDKSAISRELADWDRGLRETLERTGAPHTKDLLLERARRNPFFALLSDTRRAEVRETREALAGDPTVAAEATLRSGYFRMLDDEAAQESWAHYRTMAKRYHAFYSSNPDTYFGRRAAIDCYRLGSLLGMDGRWRFRTIEEQTKAQAEAARDPVPAVQVETVLPFFRDLAGALSPN